MTEPRGTIEFLKLPPYLPQLNPVERLWHRIKNNFIHNRFFNDINELDHALTECLRNEPVLQNAVRSVCTVSSNGIYCNCLICRVTQQKKITEVLIYDRAIFSLQENRSGHRISRIMEIDILKFHMLKINRRLYGK